MSKIINFNQVKEAVRESAPVTAKEPTVADHLHYAADALDLISHNLRVAAAKLQRGEK